MALDINQVINWNLAELYNYIQTIEEELEPEERKVLKETEQGKGHENIPIHINYLAKEYYQEYPSSQKAKIYGLGKVPIEILWKDLQNRETNLRKIIIAHIDEEGPTESRI